MAIIELEKHDHIAVITLNRPERYNALSYDMFLKLAEAFQQVEKDEDVWVSILTGAGKGFCVGLDLKEAMASGNNSDKVVLPKLPIEDPYFLDDTFQKPVIVAVHGLAVGGGFWLTMQSDLRIAAENAVFQISELLRGIPSGIYPPKWGIYRENLPYVIQAEIITGARISAQRAYEVGFVNRLVAEADLMKTAMSMANNLISVPPLATYHNLKMLRDFRRFKATLPPSIEAEGSEYYWGAYKTEDMKEANQAFIEKRKPVFKRR